jgi:hypothetical protein
MADGNQGGGKPAEHQRRRLPWIYRVAATIRLVQLALKVARKGLNISIAPGSKIVLSVEHSITWDTNDHG